MPVHETLDHAHIFVGEFRLDVEAVVIDDGEHLVADGGELVLHRCADALDVCPDAPGVIAEPPHPPGCPLPKDADGDGISDADDRCRDEPAGSHPDPELPGCPLRDQDGDGVADAQDQCIAIPAVGAGEGRLTAMLRGVELFLRPPPGRGSYRPEPAPLPGTGRA